MTNARTAKVLLLLPLASVLVAVVAIYCTSPPGQYKTTVEEYNRLADMTYKLSHSGYWLTYYRSKLETFAKDDKEKTIEDVREYFSCYDEWSKYLLSYSTQMSNYNAEMERTRFSYCDIKTLPGRIVTPLRPKCAFATNPPAGPR